MMNDTLPIKYYGRIAGAYLCQCSICRQSFKGDKRDVTCAECELKAIIAQRDALLTANQTLHERILPLLDQLVGKDGWVREAINKALFKDIEWNQ